MGPFSLRILIEERLSRPADLSSQVRKLDRDEAVCVLAIVDFMRRRGQKDGRKVQNLLSAAATYGFDRPSVKILLEESLGFRLSARIWNDCLKKAEVMLSGESLHVLETDFPCRFLFGLSKCDLQGFPKISMLNSRVPRSIKPDEPWLDSFRYALLALEGLDFMALVSVGTIGYDLFRIWAEDNEKENVIILPYSYRADGLNKKSSSFSCCISPLRCDRRTMMKCRDALIAGLSDIIIVVHLRPRSTMVENIRDALMRKKHVLVWRPSLSSLPLSGDSLISWEVSEVISKHGTLKADKVVEAGNLISRPDGSFPFGEYLYHYTRSTYGPAAQESREEYLRRLLKGDPLASNSSVDILVRIAQEGLIRAHGAMIRDGTPVVSWTSLPPGEVRRIRKWNPASLRWTLGLCGIAVKKSVLKRAGAMPACYIPSALYERLPRSERYRFQKHEPPQSDWKHEKEWRLRGDFDIRVLTPEEAFWFFLKGEDAQRFASLVRTDLPMYVFE
ncbi:hypothetical protein [Thermodesulforhabdus norvegica]|uniref:Uncharacterized protein n=1 Tax=Thermodesulforhabdus norvegica TaxID=39841 RepID=A0A1I4URA2_9BACT|nr:hypothetical protein [Thermodesulforhabdus norvegica]SFM91243.1 hypothetical protein SAMN05660836_01937 [Thermodesulforhabdus norvegica]